MQVACQEVGRGEEMDTGDGDSETVAKEVGQDKSPWYDDMVGFDWVLDADLYRAYMVRMGCTSTKLL
jgi:hypothetical protein